METAEKIAHAAERLLNTVILLISLVTFTFSAYALWDSFLIFDGDAVDGELLAYRPDVAAGPEITLYSIQYLNSDVCAWLTVNNTGIDYPVVRSADNVRYLNTNVYGEYSPSGSIILDCGSARDFTDFYSIVHGNHMEEGEMFGDLDKFVSRDFFDSNTGGQLLLDNGEYELEFFAFLEPDARDQTLYTPGDRFGDDRDALLDYIKEQAVYFRDIEFSDGDRIVSLSTTTGSSRYMLVGRLPGAAVVYTAE